METGGEVFNPRGLMVQVVHPATNKEERTGDKEDRTRDKEEGQETKKTEQWAKNIGERTMGKEQRRTTSNGQDECQYLFFVVNAAMNTSTTPPPIVCDTTRDVVFTLVQHCIGAFTNVQS